MSPTSTSTQAPFLTATSTLPLTYRILLTTVEPLFAVSGAILTLTSPSTFLHSMSHLPISYDPHMHFIFTELSGAWLMFAFYEAVVLRALDDVRIWRLLCAGMLLSDVLYAHSCAEALGGWSEWVKVGNWRSEDWAVLVGTAPFLVVRILVVLGLGFKSPTAAATKVGEKKTS